MGGGAGGVLASAGSPPRFLPLGFRLPDRRAAATGLHGGAEQVGSGGLDPSPGETGATLLAHDAWCRDEGLLGSRGGGTTEGVHCGGGSRHRVDGARMLAGDSVERRHVRLPGRAVDHEP